MVISFWTKDKENELRKMYPNTLTQDIANYFEIPISKIRNKAYSLGLKKSKEWIAENSRKNIENPNHPARKFLIKKGTTPPNKGKKQSEYMTPEAIERTKKTQFKKGGRPHNSFPDYREVLREESNNKAYWMIKLPENKRLVYKHVWIWEQQNGKVKKGDNIVFINGNSLDCKIENLELLSNAELMQRNSIHNYPEELKETIILKNKIIKKLRK